MDARANEARQYICPVTPDRNHPAVALSLVLPVYNEAESLAGILSVIESALTGIEYEVIVVDDSSPDGTGRIADDLAGRNDRIRVLHRPSKQGVASAILDGTRSARGPVVVTMNADQSKAAVLVPDMLALVASHDIVIGSRYMMRGMYTRGRWRGLVSAGARTLARAMLPKVRGVEDPTSGFFMFRKSAVEGFEVPRSGRFGRVSIGVKCLLGILAEGSYSSVYEVPFHDDLRTKGESKFSRRDYLAYLSYVLYLAGLPHEARVVARFLLVGLVGFVSYTALLYLLTERLGLFYLLSAPLSWVVIVLSSFLIHERWTFVDRRLNTAQEVNGRGLRFVGAKLLGLGLNMAILAFLSEVAGLHYIGSAAIAVAIVMAWNYAAAVRLVWNKSGR